MYIMFPIGIMYYFGVNLDEKFSTPDFWPKRNQTHTIPFEKEEISSELALLKQRRLTARQRRLEFEAAETTRDTVPVPSSPSDIAHSTVTASGPVTANKSSSWFSWLK